jgi:hypothetical protein
LADSGDCCTIAQVLSSEIASYLGLELGKIKVKRFADGEIYVQVQVSLVAWTSWPMECQEVFRLALVQYSMDSTGWSALDNCISLQSKALLSPAFAAVQLGF